MSQFLESGIYHTSTDASELLGISRARLHILIQAGKIDAVQLGHNWIFTDEAVQEFQHRRLSRLQEQVDVIGAQIEAKVSK